MAGEHPRLTAISQNQRLLIASIGALIALQILLAGVLEYKPSFNAGYDRPTPSLDAQTNTPASLSRERRRELEAILAPPPHLPWADQNQSITPPKNTPPQTNNNQIIKVEPIYLEKLPDLQSLTTQERKEKFVNIVLPLILRANDELKERQRLITIAAQNDNTKQLQQWAELYRLKNNPEYDPNNAEKILKELLKRVDQIPVSLALAQAAIESGWGTSRFATQGNALFGQWAWESDQGIKPNSPRHENVVVRSFANLFDSVRAYMHNLNTHKPYEEFRTKRLNPNNSPLTLAQSLTSYSEERNQYVDKLHQVINANNFTIYDNAELLTQ